MLKLLKIGEVVNSIPTIGFNVEELTYNDISFHMWDIGGQTKIRQLWSHYYDNLDGIMFMIDSNDVSRMEEVQKEVFKLLS